MPSLALYKQEPIGFVLHKPLKEILLPDRVNKNFPLRLCAFDTFYAFSLPVKSKNPELAAGYLHLVCDVSSPYLQFFTLAAGTLTYSLQV